jgi:hypothetical protein
MNQQVGGNSASWQPFANGTAAPAQNAAAGLGPQGPNIKDVLEIILPHVLGALSVQPQMTPQGIAFKVSTPLGGIGFGLNSAQPQLQPLESDLEKIVRVALPIILGALSAQPVVHPQGINFGLSTPLGGIGFGLNSAQPQLRPLESDLEKIVRVALPIILGALSAQPVVHPQGINFGLSTPLGGIGFGLNNAQPQLRPQSSDWVGLAVNLLPVVVQVVQAVLGAVAGGTNAQSQGMTAQSMTAQVQSAGVAPQCFQSPYVWPGGIVRGQF